MIDVVKACAGFGAICLEFRRCWCFQARATVVLQYGNCDDRRHVGFGWRMAARIVLELQFDCWRLVLGDDRRWNVVISLRLEPRAIPTLLLLRIRCPLRLSDHVWSRRASPRAGATRGSCLKRRFVETDIDGRIS